MVATATLQGLDTKLARQISWLYQCLPGGGKQVNVELTVSEQGFVNFPFIGTVKASGMTSSDMEREMVVPLERDYFMNPQVHIQVKEYHSLHFFISGAVKNPGKYEMQAATKIMDLIAKAEGVTQIAVMLLMSCMMATTALKVMMRKPNP